MSIEDSEKPELFKHDSFRMPYSTSRIPYRFIMTSAMNVDQPVDRLSSIEININQRVFHTYIQLNGVESNKKYKLRVRVIDAKGELIFDKDKVLTPSSNSIWFAATVSPKVNIDEPGTWTIQGVLNGKKLFIEKREITFPQRKKKKLKSCYEYNFHLATAAIACDFNRPLKLDASTTLEPKHEIPSGNDRQVNKSLNAIIT